VSSEPSITMLMEHLQNLPLRGGWQDRARALLKSGELSTGEDREVVLWEDEVVAVKANPQASYGYLYVCAYLRSEATASNERAGKAGGEGTERG
jgi:hypothetical protein